MFDFAGRTAIVTGAGQGMGEGIAKALAKQGARVAVNDYYIDRAERVASEISQSGGTAIGICGDVTDLSAVSTMVAQIEERLGGIDILVNNAGVPIEGQNHGSFKDTQPGDWKPIFDLNVWGVLNCVHTVISGMCQRGWGRIVTITSEARLGVGANMGLSLYGAAKAGAVGFMFHLASEVAPFGVTANCVSLGCMNNFEGCEALARASASIGRPGTPEDVGAAVVYLASAEASYVTGQVLPVNGGASIQWSVG